MPVVITPKIRMWIYIASIALQAVSVVVLHFDSSWQSVFTQLAALLASIAGITAIAHINPSPQQLPPGSGK